jgi:hypothetical protein
LSKENKKALPADMGSDYSLPGRYEESNSSYFDTVSDVPTSKGRGILIMAIVFVIISGGFFTYYFANQSEIDSRIIQNSLTFDPERILADRYDVGEFGSEHSHAAITIFVNGELINFGHPKFQLTSKYIHFENNNPYLIHKHATGVPLEMLFASMGMKLTSECFILNSFSDSETGRFCSNYDQTLSFYVNGKPYNSDLSQFVFEHNDRILISFGDPELILGQLEYLESLEIFDVPKKIPRYSGDGITI